MNECVVCMSNHIQIKRCCPDDSILDTLSFLHELFVQCEQRFEARVVRVVIRDKPEGVAERSPIKFSNICGKIDHVSRRNLYYPAVTPLLVNVKNGFGNFRGLYSKHCNLLTCTSQSSTLFRGGRCSRAIEKVVSHAILPESIANMTVHMLVAIARLGRGVCVNANYLDHQLARDERWTCVSMPQHEDMTYVKGFKLKNFKEKFIQEFKIASPQSVVINVSKHGSVNFFMTLQSDVTFRSGVEHTFIPFLQMLLDVVESTT